MKKKIMAVTLCLAMVSTFAVGCGQKNETDSGKSEEKSSGKVEIEFVQVKREAAESYTKVIEAFEKENPDIVIKQNVVPDAQEVLMTRASSDSLPDMMNHWPTDAQFVQFEDEGLLLDLSEKDYMKNIDSKYLDAVKAKDGKNYIAPYNVNFMGVYYNKDKFEEAGYTMPTKWDELIALAEEIKAKGETPFILPNKDSWTVSNLWSIVLCFIDYRNDSYSLSFLSYYHYRFKDTTGIFSKLFFLSAEFLFRKFCKCSSKSKLFCVF